MTPLYTFALSAAYPSGPVTWVVIPFAPARAIARVEPTGVIAPFHPCLPTLTTTVVCIALPSAEGIGLVT